MPLLLLTAHQFRERYGIHRDTPRAWERHKVSRFAARTRVRRRRDAQGQGQER
ncbi:hypothetical protein [Meiothermus luteus]|uniref:hypothetical protein n=1 Tax=Meiothermus luteus TaxID=2026184 RepID=UPI0015FCA2DB|nr:hypothetical protein [Meiothermus luteus]